MENITKLITNLKAKWYSAIDTFWHNLKKFCKDNSLHLIEHFFYYEDTKWIKLVFLKNNLVDNFYKSE